MRVADCMNYLLPLFFPSSLTMLSSSQLVHENLHDLIKMLRKNWGTADEIRLDLLQKQVLHGRMRSAPTDLEA